MATDGLVHAGMGSDLVALCGKMLGISGYGQVRLSYVDEQVTCVECLRRRIMELRKAKPTLKTLRTLFRDTEERLWFDPVPGSSIDDISKDMASLCRLHQLEVICLHDNELPPDGSTIMGWKGWEQ